MPELFVSSYVKLLNPSWIEQKVQVFDADVGILFISPSFHFIIDAWQRREKLGKPAGLQVICPNAIATGKRVACSKRGLHTSNLVEDRLDTLIHIKKYIRILQNYRI